MNSARCLAVNQDGGYHYHGRNEEYNFDFHYVLWGLFREFKRQSLFHIRPGLRDGFLDLLDIHHAWVGKIDNLTFQNGIRPLPGQCAELGQLRFVHLHGLSGFRVLELGIDDW